MVSGFAFSVRSGLLRERASSRLEASKDLGRCAAAALLGLGLNLPLAAAPVLAIFEDPMANVKLEAPKNGFIPRLADVGVREFLVKDGAQLLRLAQPTSSSMKFLAETRETQDPARKITDDLELIKVRLEQVGNKNKPAWQGAQNDIGDIAAILKKERKALLEGSADGSSAKDILDNKFTPLFEELTKSVRAEDVPETFRLQPEAADAFAAFNSARLPRGKLPYAIPEEYSGLPRLQGRATVEMIIKKSGGVFKRPDLSTSPTLTLRLVVDGYTHPLTSGNFVDLVNKKAYDGAKLDPQELIVQTAIKTPAPRKIPLEIFYKTDSQPTYSITSDDDNRALDTQLLPFQAFGALGMARDNDDVDSAGGTFPFLFRLLRSSDTQRQRQTEPAHRPFIYNIYNIYPLSLFHSHSLTHSLSHTQQHRYNSSTILSFLPSFPPSFLPSFRQETSSF